MSEMRPTPEFMRRLLGGCATIKTKDGKSYAKYDRISITRNKDQCSVVFFDGKDAVATVGALDVYDTSTLTLDGLKGRFPLKIV